MWRIVRSARKSVNVLFHAGLCGIAGKRPIDTVAMNQLTNLNRPVPPLRSIRIAVLLILAVLTVRCGGRSLPPLHTADAAHADPVTLRVAVGTRTDRRIRTIPLEDYVRGSVSAEMPLRESDPAVAKRLARLQAILARTYALANRDRHRRDGFDLCSTTHCQVYSPADIEPPATADLVAAAVADTRGMLITSGDGPINALFHADCGGRTSSATAVWGGPAPAHLSGVRDTMCLTTARDDWRLELERDHLRRILNTAGDTAVGGRLDELAVISRDAAGRATRIELGGSEPRIVRGERLRAVITRQLGGRAFRSTLFSVTVRGDTFQFVGRGFGHGVGLCQTGAIIRARRGATVDEILAHYYPDTRVRVLPAAAAPRRRAVPRPAPHPRPRGE